LKALSDETRLKIIKMLFGGEKCVCEIALLTKRRQSTVSIHLRKLENWGILESKRDGKSTYYNLANNKVRKILKIVNDKPNKG